MHINFALLVAITAIFHGAVALPVAHLPPQTHHYQKRNFSPPWVRVALALVALNVGGNAVIGGDKISNLREQIEELVTEKKFPGFGRQNAKGVTASAKLTKTNENKVTGQNVALMGKKKAEGKMLAGWQGEDDSEEHRWWMDKSNET